MLEKLLPKAAKMGPGFLTSIDSVLKPLAKGVLGYIKAST